METGPIIQELLIGLGAAARDGVSTLLILPVRAILVPPKCSIEGVALNGLKRRRDTAPFGRSAYD